LLGWLHLPAHEQQPFGLGALGSIYSPLHGPSQLLLFRLQYDLGFLFRQVPPHAQQKVFRVGALVGALVCTCVGKYVGIFDGAIVGETEGFVGDKVFWVSESVGAAVYEVLWVTEGAIVLVMLPVKVGVFVGKFVFIVGVLVSIVGFLVGNIDGPAVWSKVGAFFVGDILGASVGDLDGKELMIILGAALLRKVG